LPIEDGSCDVGVASLVLCSVPDASRALQELRRVIRRGGELRFYEHVISDNPTLASFQRTIDKLFWPRLGAGCHGGRDTLTAIKQAGFEVEECRRLRFKASPLIGLWTSPHILGVARRS
jgi:ubiquinone/menaquinone biosynthesis C-methylase UbiE